MTRLEEFIEKAKNVDKGFTLELDNGYIMHCMPITVGKATLIYALPANRADISLRTTGPPLKL